MSDTASDVDGKEGLPSLGTYTGERAPTGERHGQGNNVFPNGDVYDGQYVMGKRHGTGSYTWKKPKSKYVGEYVDNLKHGTGLICYPDGSRYKGSFVTGKRHGYGTYVYPNGDVYVGEFANNLKHGEGVYTYAAMGTKKKGTWVQGIMLGEAEVIQNDHKVFCTYEPVFEKPESTNPGAVPDQPEEGKGSAKIVGSQMKGPVKVHFVKPDYAITIENVEKVGGGKLITA